MAQMQKLKLKQRPSPKVVHRGLAARQRLLNGVLLLARAVGITYGPCGRTVLLDRFAGILGTKDGVTVAREVDPTDPIERLGVRLLRESAIKVNAEVGDGTTSTVIIAARLLSELHKLVVAGYDPVQLSEELKAALQDVLAELPNYAFPVETQEDLTRVGMIACNGDADVASTLAEACMAVGADGTVTLEEGKGVGIELDFKEGMELDRGPVSELFLHDQTERVFNDALVAVVGGRLCSIEDVQSIMETASQWPDNPLVIFAEDIIGDAQSTMLMNDVRGLVTCVGIPAPGFHTWKKEYLKDIAAICGAVYFDPAAGGSLQAWDAESFGTLKHVHLKHKQSTLIPYDDCTEATEERKRVVLAEMKHIVSEHDRDRIKERIARLTSSMCVLRVGGYTESEIRERRARIEDALGAIQASLRSGCVPGAGWTYLQLREACPKTLGGQVLRSALAQPVRVLCRNAGEDPEALLVQYACQEGTIGWDPLNRTFRNLVENPVICDPADVVRAVLNAAVSVATTLTLVEGSITNARQ